MTKPYHVIAGFWLTAGLVVGICQLVRIQLASFAILNHGLAFSINLPTLAIFVVMALFIGLMIWLFYARQRLGWRWGVALGLIVGGGASNLVDRIILKGGVADYWQIGNLSTINLADIAITTGIIIAIWLLTITYGTNRNI